VKFFCAKPVSDAILSLDIEVWNSTETEKIGDVVARVAFDVIAPNRTLSVVTFSPSRIVTNSNGSATLYSNPSTNNNAMFLTCWSDTPVGFKSGQGDGRFFFVQLVSGTAYTQFANGLKTYHHEYLDWRLDTTFTYGFDPDIFDPAFMSYPANLPSSTGNKTSHDRPTMGIGTEVAYDVDLHFRSFLAYQSPPNGVMPTPEYVPLAYHTWDWKCNGSRSNPTETWNDPTSGASDGTLVNNPPTNSFDWLAKAGAF
jgi:hypothetical protein